MKNKDIKNKLYELLHREADTFSVKDWNFVNKHLTYEIINDFIDDTGIAVMIPGLTEEVKVYTISANQILKYYENK
jgi:thymidine kinase